MKTSPNLLLLISIFGLIVATSCKEVSSKFGASGELLNIDQLIAEDPGGLPVELFFDNQKQTNYTVSPDGKYIAWLAPWNEERNIFVRNLSNGKESRLTEESGADLRHYFWANHHKILFLKDRDGNEQYRLFSADIYTGEIKDLTPFDNVQIEIVSELPDKEDELIISMNKRNPRLFEPYKLNIETGEMVRLAENRNLKEPITWWMTDHNGELRVALSVTDGTHLNLLYRDKVSDPFKKLLTTDWTEYMHPLFFDFDNHYLYASSNLNRDCAAIVRFDPHSAKEVETIFEHEDVDVYDMGFSRGRQKLTWVGYAHDKWQINFLDSAASRLYRRVKYRLCDLEVANVEVKIPSIDKEERIFIIRTYTDRSLGAWYLYDRVTDRLEKLGDVNSNIDDQQMAEMEPISYQTRDGVTIHGYLTKPNVSTSKPLPVIVLPHGGPRNRDYWGFNAEVQFLASRGYAVLQTNYRGSIGYGRAFASAGFGQWGGIIQDDITDGVLWLIEQGIADPDRVAIYGFSFGGYSALSGVTATPELYQCAIDHSGVSNLFAFIDSIPPTWEPYRDMIIQMVGHPQHDSAMLNIASPALHLENIEVPVFIAQGARDPRVNYRNTEELVDGLLEEGNTVAFMFKEDEGHGFTKSENKLEFYKAMAGFLARYMPAELPNSELN